jgi:cytochrome c oxidase assembly protein subunit 15
VIVTGAAVRLTGSGLGCPQWPDCQHGHVVAPLSFYAQVEFINRVTTLAVSIAISLAAVAAFLRAPRRRDLTWLSIGLAIGLAAEVVLGGETVRHRLEPGFVMAHFLLSLVILWDAVVLHHRAGSPDGVSRRPLADRRSVAIARLLVVLVAVTAIAGTVVTGAGPHSGANASDGRVRRWHLDLHRVTQVHGAAAMLTLVAVAATWWLLRSRHAGAAAVHHLQLLLEAVCLQVAIGYTQYFMGVPVFVVAFHIVGVVLVWIAALRCALALSSGGADETREARERAGERSPVVA